MDFKAVSNEDLYRMCQRGDNSAWKYVYNFVFHIVRDPNWRFKDPLEDITQSIVCHLIEKLDRVKNSKAFRSFIATLATYFILDTVRKKTIATESIDKDDDETFNEPASNDPSSEGILLEHELVYAIEYGVKELPENCQDVLSAYIDYKMGEYDNLKELAKMFQKTLGTLSSQIKRCMDRLLELDTIKVWFV